MRTIDAAEAQARLNAILDEAQRQPIVIRLEGQDIAAIVSIGDYESIRVAGVTRLIQARNDAAQEAAANGLTEDRLNELIASDES
jgi:PHD/YefM family antitoxin component YafN of YafNO toxin-antitoxin module